MAAEGGLGDDAGEGELVGGEGSRKEGKKGCECVCLFVFCMEGEWRRKAG